MAFVLAMGSILQCPMGAMPTPITVLPAAMVFGKPGPMASITDCAPFVNITPFGVCSSLLNPVTAALTAAAFGVLTPGPCIPVPAGTWLPTKPTVMTKLGCIATTDSILMCAFGGVIKCAAPSQFTVMA